MTAPNTGCEAAEQRIQELEKQLEAAEAKLHDRRRRAGKKWNGKFRKGDRVYVILNGFRFNGTVIKHKRPWVNIELDDGDGALEVLEIVPVRIDA